MNRIDLIKSMVGRKKAVGVAKPAGLFVAGHPGVKAVTRPRVHCPATRGTLLAGRFESSLAVGKPREYLSRVESKGVATFTERHRQPANAIARIAEKLRRK